MVTKSPKSVLNYLHSTAHYEASLPKILKFKTFTRLWHYRKNDIYVAGDSLWYMNIDEHRLSTKN